MENKCSKTRFSPTASDTGPSPKSVDRLENKKISPKLSPVSVCRHREVRTRLRGSHDTRELPPCRQWVVWNRLPPASVGWFDVLWKKKACSDPTYTHKHTCWSEPLQALWQIVFTWLIRPGVRWIRPLAVEAINNCPLANRPAGPTTTTNWHWNMLGLTLVYVCVCMFSCLERQLVCHSSYMMLAARYNDPHG